MDPFEYRWRRALLQVCGAVLRFFVLKGGCSQRGKIHVQLTRLPTDPPAVPAMARVSVWAGVPTDAHRRVLCAAEPGIEPPLMLAEDWYSLR